VGAGHCNIGAILHGSNQSKYKGGEKCFPTCIATLDLAANVGKIDGLWIIVLVAAVDDAMH